MVLVNSISFFVTPIAISSCSILVENAPESYLCAFQFFQSGLAGGERLLVAGFPLVVAVFCGVSARHTRVDCSETASGCSETPFDCSY
ncbi:hypothetical protein KP77_26190 [Jeotgalibacillus alimentarius]|uniref:Uncharacterized protein n=1 Tax=Jeotgalibacillus alimentarius TaxID=135826 RepID=A0A0C2VRB1_9BACL|nr:hypothetical protein KP77_26190 [Jeotgalibacillus alimentarius]